MFPFDPREVLRKPLVSGGAKGSTGKKAVKIEPFMNY